MSVLSIFILIALPLAEIYLFAALGEILGAATIVWLCIFTAVFGLVILRRNGVGAILKVQQRISIGKPPVKELLNGVLIIVGGFLLILPGFITDILGLMLFTAWGRLILVVTVLRHIRPDIFATKVSPQEKATAKARPANPVVIEGEYRVEKDGKPPKQ